MDSFRFCHTLRLQKSAEILAVISDVVFMLDDFGNVLYVSDAVS